MYYDQASCIVQSVTCLTADPGVASLILARSHTSLEIDHEIISTAILLPSANSRADLDTHADHSKFLRDSCSIKLQKGTLNEHNNVTIAKIYISIKIKITTEKNISIYMYQCFTLHIHILHLEINMHWI